MQKKRSLSHILLTTILFLFLTTSVTQAAELSYSLSMPEPHTHYFQVKAELDGIGKKKHIDFTLPVWAPGSYLVREFAKNIEAFTATDGKGKFLRSEKIDKNTWRVYSNQSNSVQVSYKVYAYELTVRTSYLDASHGYLNGTSIFMYPEGYEQLGGKLTVTPFNEWKKVSTGLKSTGQFTYTFPNYDVLADSPIEIGNHEIYQFTAAGVPHEVAIYGVGNFKSEKLIADIKKIVEESISLMGDLPVKDKYVFIVHNLEQGGGGLEHLNSTTLQTSRWNYGTEKGYIGFLSLVAHEYFHLWNVKRLRPEGLGPFNYNQENYTRQLWVSEGITSYYDDLIARRAGFISPDNYLNIVESTINSVENTPGNKVQPVTEASFDAWIKYYRRNENSNNAEVSYYTKGGLIGHLLNMEIMGATNGEKSLDDVMRFMYERYYNKLNRGYRESEFKEAVEQFAGKKMDTFFNDYVYGTKSPDYNDFFSIAGLKVMDKNKGTNKGSWGANTAQSAGKLIVKSVVKGSSAYEGGLNVNDEIIAIDGFRADDSISRFVTGKNPGDEISVVIARDGILQTLKIKVLKDTSVDYEFSLVDNPTPAQKKILSKWLTLN
jgi:predicted metalloprotease with PDZ domain